MYMVMYLVRRRIEWIGVGVGGLFKNGGYAVVHLKKIYTPNVGKC